MTTDDLVINQWYRSPKSRGQLFLYEGVKADGPYAGAYVFSKFNSLDPKNPGEVVTTIEIFNLDDLEPWHPEFVGYPG